ANDSRTAAASLAPWKSEAKPATPNAVPTWRLTLSTPAPMPESEGGTLARIAALAVGATRPPPTPIATSAGLHAAYGADGGRSAAVQALATRVISPARNGPRVPNRATSRPATTLVTPNAIGTALRCRPASAGDSPRTCWNSSEKTKSEPKNAPA